MMGAMVFTATRRSFRSACASRPSSDTYARAACTRRLTASRAVTPA